MAVVTLIKETPHSKAHMRTHKPGVCFRCGQAGHYQRDCHKLPSRSKQRLHSQNHYQSTGKHHAEIGKEKERGTPDSEGGQMFVANEVLLADTEDEWSIDPRVSRHMTYQRGLLRRYKEFNKLELVGLGNRRTVKTLGTGEVKFISFLHQNKRMIGWMSNVL